MKNTFVLAVPALAAQGFPGLSAHERLSLEKGHPLLLPFRLKAFEGLMPAGSLQVGQRPSNAIEATLRRASDPHRLPWKKDPDLQHSLQWAQRMLRTLLPNDRFAASILGFPDGFPESPVGYLHLTTKDLEGWGKNKDLWAKVHFQPHAPFFILESLSAHPTHSALVMSWKNHPYCLQDLAESSGDFADNLYDFTYSYHAPMPPVNEHRLIQDVLDAINMRLSTLLQAGSTA